MKKSVAAFCLILIGLLPCSGLHAEESRTPESGVKREIRDTIAGSVNNAGLQNLFDVSWSWGLSSSPSALRRDAHVALGVSHYLTPSYTRVGAWAEIAPLSVLEIRVGVEPSAYFGTFDSLMSFDSYDDAFDRENRASRGDQAGFGTAGRVYVSPTFRLKLGSVVALSSADLEWWRSGVSGPLFYEPARDTLLKTSGDRMLATSSLLLHQRELSGAGTLAVGFIHQLTYVYDAPANRVQRLGAVAMRQLEGRRFGCNAPRVAGYAWYYLNDRFKKGQLGAALGVSFKLGR